MQKYRKRLKYLLTTAIIRCIIKVQIKEVEEIKMTTFASAEELESYLEDNCGGYYAVRGLSGYNTTVSYNDGDEIAKSFDLYDDRGTEYREDAKRLNGTSGIEVSDMMYSDEIMSVVDRARKYSNGRIILMRGEKREDGEDNKEVIICGATFCGEIRF